MGIQLIMGQELIRHGSLAPGQNAEQDQPAETALPGWEEGQALKEEKSAHAGASILIMETFSLYF